MSEDVRADRLNALADQMDALLDYANETTGAGDTRIGDALKTLADGYEQGGELTESSFTLDVDTALNGFQLDEVIGKKIVYIVDITNTTPRSSAAGNRPFKEILFINGVSWQFLTTNSSVSSWSTATAFTNLPTVNNSIRYDVTTGLFSVGSAVVGKSFLSGNFKVFAT